LLFYGEFLWIYLSATTMGAILAIPVWKFIAEKKPVTN